ncbi:MAG: threonine-phosphate decarboxylase CobD [Pseudomonadota bacterium]|nr:threonine-phosphate decarboxylase CobD [Pseudomonadota bacterium]MDP1903085.1 threonine-phosphate decarboxylase CobD [Pseudomonadota bacterium]MDP2353075.1 threonine-phosphate decarboxylase CobD [Pseudomonadota bacterium]
MLEHGGRLRRAAVEYGIPLAEWLDLSTGINPNGWPVPTLPPLVWQRLPEDDDGLSEAACAYYGARHALAVAGSQAAIQALPLLRAPCRVGVVAPGYAEHAHAWAKAGHEVVDIPAGAGLHPQGARRIRKAAEAATTPLPAIAALDRGQARSYDVLVLIHPNNPTGQTYAPATLLAWHERLAARGGWLVIDEAFMDATPEFSLAAHAHLPGLIVLRSLGKFFGLAGARVGFVLAEAALLERLHDLLGPWALNGPARHIATLTLRDTAWQDAARPKLIAAAARLADVLAHHGLPPSGGSALFQRVETPRANEIHAALARRGILTRLFEHPASLRFGLPGTASEWARLDAALAKISP